jgi:hypothetical protein
MSLLPGWQVMLQAHAKKVETASSGSTGGRRRKKRTAPDSWGCDCDRSLESGKIILWVGVFAVWQRMVIWTNLQFPNGQQAWQSGILHWMINLNASLLQWQPVTAAKGPSNVTSQGSFEHHKQKHQEMIWTSGNAKSILVFGSEKGQIMVLRIWPWHPHVDTAKTSITRFDTLAVYFNKDAIACQMASAIIKLPMLQVMCQSILRIDVSWRSRGSLNTYLLPVIVMHLFAFFLHFVSKILNTFIISKTHYDIHEWGEGENHKTVWNLLDADRHSWYKNTFLNNACLLELAEKIFVVIASE